MTELFPAYTCKHFQVSEAFHNALTNTYPHVDLYEEYGRMSMWLEANPRKARKSNWPRFVVNWLMRQPKPSAELRVGRGPSDIGTVRVKTEALRRAMGRK